MKFTLSWLKDHLDTEASLDEILYALTDLGLEVEEVTNPAARLADFTLGKVVHAEQHPDADRLNVCQVETDEGVTGRCIRGTATVDEAAEARSFCGILQGDWGYSSVFKDDVSGIIATRLGLTGKLMFWVLMLMVPSALIVGVLAGMREGSKLDRSLSTFSIATTATPEYVSGVILTILLWGLAGAGFSYYLAQFASYNATYAGLAGVMVALIFLYLMSALLILGAEFNGALEKRAKRNKPAVSP